MGVEGNAWERLPGQKRPFPRKNLTYREDMGSDGNPFIVLDPDGDRQPNLPEDLLRHETVSLPDAFRIRSSSGRPQLRYLPNGMSTGSNLTVRICLQERLMTEVIVNNAGRARSRRNGSGETCPP